MRHDETVVQEFEMAFDRLWAVALGVARRFFGPGLTGSQRAEDIAQETLTRAFEHWERATRHDRVDAWVATTATNVCLEVARKGRRSDDRISGLPAPSLDTEQSVDDADALARALRRLTARERDVVVWRHLLDCSEAETAEALGITVSQVKDAAHRGRRKLQASLDRTTGALV